MTAPFRRPPSRTEFLPDLWKLIRARPQSIRQADVAAASVQLLSLPHAEPEPTPEPELSLAEMMDIRTYDRRIAAAREATS